MKKLIISFVSLSLIIVSCKKDDPTPTPTTNTTNTTKEEIYYVKATVGDYSYEQKTDDNYYISMSGQLGTFGSDSTLSPSFGSQIEVSSSSKSPQMAIYFQDNFMTTDQYYKTDTNFYAVFKIGNHDFKNPDNKFDFDFPGINITYSDYVDGKISNWETQLGDQTGSSFKVTEVTTAVNELKQKVIRVKGTFNCKLYSWSNSSISKKVENGTFYLQYYKL